MVQLNTNYDSALHEKVFILKGEEAYARTTDCILTEILHPSGTGVDPDTGRLSDWNHYLTSFAIELKVEVLRNLDASTIVLYDNDTVLATAPYDDNTECVEWKYVDSSHDNRIRLAYDIEHNLYVKYIGNKKCLKSQSKNFTISEPIPEAFESSIAFNGLNTNYDDISSTISFTIKFTSEEYISNKSIKVYVDDVLKDTYTTGNDGETSTITLSNLTTGLHHIYAKFGGDTYSSACDVSKDISVGYNITVTNAPYSILSGSTQSLQVTALDWFNEPVSSKTLTLNLYNGSSYSSATTGATDSNGKVTLSYAVNNKYYVSYSNSSSIVYEPIVFNPTSITISANPTIISKNNSSSITVNVPSAPRGIPVNVTDGSTNTTTVKYTDDSGNIIFGQTGNSVGDYDITAGIKTYSATVSIEDVLQYWKRGNVELNKDIIIYHGSLTNVTNGYKIGFANSPTTYYGEIGFKHPTSKATYLHDDFELSFKIVAVPSSTIFISAGYGYDSERGYSVVTYDDEVHSNNTVLLKKDGNILKLYYSGTLVDSYDLTSELNCDYADDCLPIDVNSYPVVSINTAYNRPNDYIIIDDLKYKVIS